MLKFSDLLDKNDMTYSALSERISSLRNEIYSNPNQVTFQKTPEWPRKKLNGPKNGRQKPLLRAHLREGVVYYEFAFKPAFA